MGSGSELSGGTVGLFGALAADHLKPKVDWLTLLAICIALGTGKWMFNS